MNYDGDSWFWQKSMFADTTEKGPPYKWQSRLSFYFLMVTFFVALHAEMSSFCPFPSMVYARTRT